MSMTLISPALVNFCRTTVPLLLGVAQALGVSSVYVSDPSLITQLLFPNHSGQATPKEPQLPRALSRSAPRRFLSFPQGKRDDSYHLSDEQLNNLITKVSYIIVEPPISDHPRCQTYSVGGCLHEA